MKFKSFNFNRLQIDGFFKIIKEAGSLIWIQRPSAFESYCCTNKLSLRNGVS